jgi:hypothetical protein
MMDEEVRWLARWLADQAGEVYQFLSQGRKDEYLNFSRWALGVPSE